MPQKPKEEQQSPGLHEYCRLGAPQEPSGVTGRFDGAAPEGAGVPETEGAGTLDDDAEGTGRVDDEADGTVEEDAEGTGTVDDDAEGTGKVDDDAEGTGTLDDDVEGTGDPDDEKGGQAPYRGCRNEQGSLWHRVRKPPHSQPVAHLAARATVE